MRKHIVLLGTLTAAGLYGACSGGTKDQPASTDSGVDAFVVPPVFSEPDSAADANAHTFSVDPPTVTVTATGTLALLSGTQAFQARLDGAASTQQVNWSVEDESIGTISAAGIFSAGHVAGATKVTARLGALQASADVSVKLKVDEDFVSLSAQDKAALRAGGSADAANFRWLYPYDKTVFPRGLGAPTLQFGGSTPSAFFVHVKSIDVDYSGFYQGTGAVPRIPIDPNLWNTITRSAHANDPVKVEVTKIDAGSVTGPISETWTIAQGNLQGTVYYNTYSSALARAADVTGAIMRVKPGKTAEVFIGKTSGTGNSGTDGGVVDAGTLDGGVRKCTVCHSVSGDGTLLAAGMSLVNSSPIDSATFSISKSGVATPSFLTDEGRTTPFGGLSFDGKWLVGNAAKAGGPNVRNTLNTFEAPDFPSYLYNAQTGAKLVDAYFSGGSRFLLMPTFSPDGKRLAFTDRTADTTGRTLGLLDIDLTTSPPTFTAPGNPTLATSSTTELLGWPAFTPDGNGVLYQKGPSGAASFSTGGYRDPATDSQLSHFCSDLSWVETKSRTSASLARLNGYNGNVCYLPYCGVPDPDPGKVGSPCNTEDAHMNYEPTVLPVPAGGYYWVVFTSRRAFGNTIYNGGNSLSAAGDPAFDNTKDLNGDLKGYRKKLWVAAIDINGTPGTDISHPAFYLEGQELLAGNMRGFWVLDPCRNNGDGCEEGDQCCGGFCRQATQADGGTGKMCVPPPTGCSQDSEKCAVKADCCGAITGSDCIHGYCALPTPN